MTDDYLITIEFTSLEYMLSRLHAIDIHKVERGVGPPSDVIPVALCAACGGDSRVWEVCSCIHRRSAGPA